MQWCGGNCLTLMLLISWTRRTPSCFRTNKACSISDCASERQNLPASVSKDVRLGEKKFWGHRTDYIPLNFVQLAATGIGKTSVDYQCQTMLNVKLTCKKFKNLRVNKKFTLPTNCCGSDWLARLGLFIDQTKEAAFIRPSFRPAAKLKNYHKLLWERRGRIDFTNGNHTRKKP